MLTKEQYERLLPFKPMLEQYEKTSSSVGGYQGLYDIYESIFNTKVMRGCRDCIGRMLVDSLMAIKQYERKSIRNSK